MKELINEIKKDKFIPYTFLISLLILVVTIIFILLNFRGLPPFIPIFNQLPWGDQRLVDTPGIFIPVGIYFLIFIFNFFFSGFLYKKNNPLLSRIIASVTLMLSIINFLFILKIIFLFT